MSKNISDVILEIMGGTPKPTTTIIASVVSPPPDLTIKFGEITIPSKQIYCSNYLLPDYHRDFKIDGVIDEIEVKVDNYSYDNTTKTVVGTIPTPPYTPSPPPHIHPINNLNGSGNFKGDGSYKSHKDLWFTDTLKAGDEVLVNVVGVYYVVVSKITRMPSGAIEGV